MALLINKTIEINVRRNKIINLDSIFDQITRGSNDTTTSLMHSLESTLDVDKMDVTGYLVSQFLKNPATDSLLTRKIHVHRAKEFSLLLSFQSLSLSP